MENPSILRTLSIYPMVIRGLPLECNMWQLLELVPRRQQYGMSISKATGDYGVESSRGMAMVSAVTDSYKPEPGGWLCEVVLHAKLTCFAIHS